MGGITKGSGVPRAVSELGKNYDPAAAAERGREDRAEQTRIARAEAGITVDICTAVEEAMQSTSIGPLRERRIREVLAARETEITVSNVLRFAGRAGADRIQMRLLGMEWNAATEAWLPTGTPIRPTVQLRRVDRHESFPLDIGAAHLGEVDPNTGEPLTGGGAGVLQRVSRDWLQAGQPGLDPTREWVLVTVDSETGDCCPLPPRLGLIALRRFQDSNRRKRRRAAGDWKDPNPILVEVGAGASSFTPTVAKSVAELEGVR